MEGNKKERTVVVLSFYLMDIDYLFYSDQKPKK